MRCHMHRSKDGERFFIPGCWGGVHEGFAGCYCRTERQTKQREQSRDEKIEELQNRVAALEKQSRLKTES